MSNQKPKGLTRSDLYEAAWTESISRLAPKCGLTDVGLAKLCRRLNIPLPGRGYWRKLETGKRVPKRPRLPSRSAVSSDAIVASLSGRPGTPPSKKATTAPTLDLAALHPVAALALARLRNARPGKDDVLAPGYLGIRVLPDTIDRAVLIADALAREFERRGCIVGTDCRGDGVVGFDRDEVSFDFREDPITGRLSLVRDRSSRGRRTWSDGVNVRLEKQLDGFIASVEASLARLRSERLTREQKEAFAAQLNERKVERTKLADQERAMERSVWRAMLAWERATRLRKFAASIDAAVNNGDLRAPAFAEMAEAARAYAHRVDPLVPVKPERLATMDYMKFSDWYARAVAILGKEDGYKRYGAQRLFELRMTPEEAAAEIDWEAFWV
jgi:hypothetical protein